MTSWYEAVCDEHKEFCSIFTVSWGSKLLNWPLGDDAHQKAADEFLTKHWACKLRLVRDDNEDTHSEENGYKDMTPP